jgi:hypothetical protein
MPKPKDFYQTFKTEPKDEFMYEKLDAVMETAYSVIPGYTLKVEVTVYDDKKEENRIRTEAQNKYYHKLLDIICDHTGDTHMDIHNNLKAEFLSRPWVKGDKEYLIVKSTKELTSKEFTVYIERVFQYASTELGLTLPSSEDYY